MSSAPQSRDLRGPDDSANPGDVGRRRDRLDQPAVEAALRAAGVAQDLGRVQVVASTASTSTDLLGLATSAPADWPDRSVLVADHQAAGRGRAGRSWETPPGTALTVSVLLRPRVDLSRLGWVPLLAGLAVVQAVGEVAGVHAVLKWPNDVLVVAPDGGELAGWGRYRKVAGVLGDLAVGSGSVGSGSVGSGGVGSGSEGSSGDGPAVVVGMGINVAQTAEQLPVPSASSLASVTGAAGAAGLTGAQALGGVAGTGMGPISRVELLAALLDRLVSLDARWRAAGGDAWAAGLGAQCAAVCVTLGSTVRIELPGGGVLDGVASRLAVDGALEVVDAVGTTHAVHAGDVRHVRSGRSGAGLS